jgi:DNA-binding response OmpR family regulator
MARILLIENDQYVSLLCQEQLTEDGHTVIPVFDAASAVDSCVLSRPDLIIMEHLDAKDDLEFIQELRKVDGHVPIVLHTGYPVHDHVTSWAAVAIVRKSADLRQLRATVARVLAPASPSA